jgi:hypothetical protein
LTTASRANARVTCCLSTPNDGEGDVSPLKTLHPNR